jgi:endogenous inhibitor of DNA gyrase (YacG/DUF329 family)
MDDSQILPPRRCRPAAKPATQKHRLFGSSCCAQIDLGRWLKGFTASKPIKAPNESDEERQVAIGSRLTQPAPAASMVIISDLGAE